MNNSRTFFLGLATGICLQGCAPTVHLDTPEPLKVDISMRIDLYQQEGPSLKKRLISEDENKAIQRRELRSGEIWGMKNDGALIESTAGYLQVNPKSGWDTQYLNRMATEENRDRRMLYEAEAREDARPLNIIEEEAGKRLREQIYIGTTNQTTKSLVK